MVHQGGNKINACLHPNIQVGFSVLETSRIALNLLLNS